MSKIILGGVLQTFPKNIGGRVYSEDLFQKALEDLKHKMLLNDRINKINKLNEKIKGNN